MRDLSINSTRFYKIFIAAPGTGTALDWNFCSSNTPCKSKEGDCDADSHCAKDHFCGQDNCRDFWDLAELKADCCVPGDSIHIIHILWNRCDTLLYQTIQILLTWFKTSEVKLLGGSGHLLDCYIWYTCHTFNSKSSEVKLLGGSGPHEGNIFVGGFPVCDDHHGVENARVVCRFGELYLIKSLFNKKNLFFCI